MSRTAIALPVGVLGFILYVMVVVALGDIFRDTHWLIELLYFAAAGIVWVFPTRKLMFWAARAPR